MNWLSAPLRLRFIAWSVFMLVMLGVFAFRVLPNLAVETDILALLPQTRQDPDLDAALQAFSAELARKQIFLVGSTSPEEARRAANAFVAGLRGSDAFASVQLELDGDLRQRAAVYLQHRAWLLAPHDRDALASGATAPLLNRALRAAYTPLGLMNPLSLADDPLGFTNDFLRAQTPVTGRARLEDSTLVVDHDGWRYLLVLAENRGSPFATDAQERVMPAIEQARITARAAVTSRVDILSSGAIQHAAAAATRARQEISTFGTIESLAVVVLLVSVFGALRPLLLGLLTLSLAVVAAFTLVHWLFGEVHLLALVFGSSLIGSVIDYSIHFFADRFRDPARWTPADALPHVGPAILLGLTTTLIGYLVLAVVPFPGLRQIAVFCMTGLVVGCGCVLCLYPVLAHSFGKPRPLPRIGSRAGEAIDAFLKRWRWNAAALGISAAILIGALLGLTRLRVQDDVKALQQSPPQLIDEERRVRELLGSGIETRFFLVSGDSAQALLENEEKLVQVLEGLVRDNALTYYQAVSRGLPSAAQQARDHEMLARLVYPPGALLDQVMGRLGFEPDLIEKRRTEFNAASSPLSVDEWLASPASQGFRHLWLGEVGSRHASIVTLGGIGDLPALEGIALDNVRLVDRVAETSQILSQYRRTMTALLAAIYCVAAIVLLIRFGWRDVPRMLLPSVFATLTTLGLFGWLGLPFNLFTLLALWLVLGLGIDYGIFLRHGREHRPTAILSVTLSACTTLIAFGLLAFSATPFIRSIGSTLLVAITLSWLFVLLSCLTTFTRNREEKVIHG
jgi:predicted exporter